MEAEALSTQNGRLPRYQQAPPATYSQVLCAPLECCPKVRPFDPVGMWVWTVLFDRARLQRDAGTFNQLSRITGVPRTTLNRVCRQLRAAGLLQLEDGVVLVALPSPEEARANLETDHRRLAHSEDMAVSGSAELGGAQSGQLPNPVSDGGAHTGQTVAHSGQGVAHSGQRARNDLEEEQEQELHARRPDWVSGTWWTNLKRRHGRREAEAAVAHTIFLCRTRGDIRNPRGYAQALAAMYARADGDETLQAHARMRTAHQEAAWAEEKQRFAEEAGRVWQKLIDEGVAPPGWTGWGTAPGVEAGDRPVP